MMITKMMIAPMKKKTTTMMIIMVMMVVVMVTFTSCYLLAYEPFSFVYNALMEQEFCKQVSKNIQLTT